MGFTIAFMDSSVQEPDDGLPRAEELIALIYADLVRCRDSGTMPEKVFLSARSYRCIQEWRKRLGGLESPGMDYLGSTHIFHLEIFIDDSRDLVLA